MTMTLRYYFRLLEIKPASPMSYQAGKCLILLDRLSDLTAHNQVDRTSWVTPSTYDIKGLNYVTT